MSDITPEEYEELQHQIVIFAGLLQGLEKLPAFIAAIHHAESVGPLFNPTLYMVGNPKMQVIRQIAEALQTARAHLPSMDVVMKAEQQTVSAARMAGVHPRTGAPILRMRDALTEEVDP